MGSVYVVNECPRSEDFPISLIDWGTSHRFTQPAKTPSGVLAFVLALILFPQTISGALGCIMDKLVGDHDAAWLPLLGANQSLEFGFG